jgi:hypothetical protein
MGRSGLLQAVMKYQPAGNRKPGRLLKKLQDCYIETGMDHVA